MLALQSRFVGFLFCGVGGEYSQSTLASPLATRDQAPLLNSRRVNLNPGPDATASTDLEPTAPHFFPSRCRRRSPRREYLP